MKPTGSWDINKIHVVLARLPEKKRRHPQPRPGMREVTSI